MPKGEAASSGAAKTEELVLLDYELWSEGGNEPELIDTTRAAVADKAGHKASPGVTFAPRAHILGGDYFPASIEAAIAAAKVGEDVTQTFPPAEAFGERDPKLIELLSMHEVERLPEMRRDDADLNIGTILTIKGRRGRVASLTAARVRVDFNPPFTGRTVRASFKVVEPITDPAEKARGVIDILYGWGTEFHVEVHNNVVKAKLPDRARFDISWLAAKPRVVERLRRSLHPKAIEFIEEYETPAEPKPEVSEAPSPAAEKKTDEPRAHAPKKSGDTETKPAHAKKETGTPTAPEGKAHEHHHHAEGSGHEPPAESE
jgi:peptidylprolyl isomerase